MTAGNSDDDSSDIPADVRDATAFFQRRRPLFWAALAWMAGIILDDRLALHGSLVAATSLPLIAASGIVLIRSQGTRWKLLALSAAALACGIIAHASIARILPDNHISKLTPPESSVVQLEGVVVQCTHTPRGGARWVLNCERLRENESVEAKDASGLVQLFIAQSPADVLEGSRVRVQAKIQAPRDTFPDDFDLVAYLARNGIHRTGNVIPKSRIETDLPRAWSPLLWMRRGSHALSARVDALLPPLQLEGRSPESQSALLSALLFGRREQLDRHDRDAFAATGTAHLLAISGLQIQFMALLLWTLLKCCRVSRRTNAILLFGATWAYTALSGAEPPIVRAAVMISLVLLSQLAWREVDALSLLGTAAIVILAFDPGQLFQAGFQLSFAAVFALVTLVPLFNDALRRRADDPLALVEEPSRHGLRQRLTDLALVSFAAWLGTAPIIAYHMEQFSILSVPANLIAVPLSGVAMICGLAGLLLAALSTTLAAPFAWAAFALLALLQTLTDLAASIPFSTLRVASPPIFVLLLYAAITLALWIKRGSVHLPLLASAACILLIGSIASGAIARSDSTSKPSITFLNLGRGHAVILKSGSDAVLIDAGPPSAGPRLAAYLQERGVQRLKAAIVLENEFGSLGGLTEVVERVPTGRIILSHATTPDAIRRDLEATLRTKMIAFDSHFALAKDILPGFTIELGDDRPPDTSERLSETTLAARITCGEASLLIIPTRSAASLDRLQKQHPDSFLQSRTVVLTGHYSGHWPRNTDALLDRCNARRLISLAHEDHDDAVFKTSRMLYQIHDNPLWLAPDGKDWRVKQFWKGMWRYVE